MRNKKADISVLLLVLMTLILVISALFIFNLNSKKTTAKIIEYNSLNDIYSREKEINFYINDIMERVGSRIDKNKNIKAEFIKNFKKELERYKNEDVFYIKELEQLDSQLISNNVEYADKTIKINFNIHLEKRFENIIIIYSYKKEFSRILVD